MSNARSYTLALLACVCAGCALSVESPTTPLRRMVREGVELQPAGALLLSPNLAGEEWADFWGPPLVLSPYEESAEVVVALGSHFTGEEVEGDDVKADLVYNGTSGAIYSCAVMLDYEADTDLWLAGAHGIGHCLGWADNDVTGHVMCRVPSCRGDEL